MHNLQSFVCIFRCVLLPELSSRLVSKCSASIVFSMHWNFLLRLIIIATSMWRPATHYLQEILPIVSTTVSVFIDTILMSLCLIKFVLVKLRIKKVHKSKAFISHEDLDYLLVLNEFVKNGCTLVLFVIVDSDGYYIYYVVTVTSDFYFLALYENKV